MTYKQTLRWLADNWNGEFGEKCNVEMRSTGVPFIQLEMDVLEDIVDEEAALRLTRAEVEKRTGRKVIEWREPTKYDVFASIDAEACTIGPCFTGGPRWILGDKLDASCTGCNSLPCVCTKLGRIAQQKSKRLAHGATVQRGGIVPSY